MQQGLPPEVFWAAICIGGGIGLVIGTVIQAFFAWSLARTVREVAESNRAVSPGTVWLSVVLNQIPIVGSIWEISIVNRVARSLRQEFEARGWDASEERFGRTAGLLWAWGGLIYLPVSGLQLYFQFSGDMATASLISVLSLPVALGLLVCFILYWVQMWQYGTRLRDERRRPRRDGLEDDYDEYRGRRGDQDRESDGHESDDRNRRDDDRG